MFGEENLKQVLKYAKMHVVQLVALGLVSMLSGFLLCKSVTEPCIREVVCKEVIEDNKKLSVQLKDERKVCLDEKAELGKSLKDTFVTECNKKVKEALKNCDFSEKHHCPICKARGVCK